MTGFQEMTFEQCMEELDAIVGKLELASNPLAEMVALYERGAKLGEHCLGMLEGYQGKFEMIRQNITPEGEK